MIGRLSGLFAGWSSDWRGLLRRMIGFLPVFLCWTGLRRMGLGGVLDAAATVGDAGVRGEVLCFVAG